MAAPNLRARVATSAVLVLGLGLVLMVGGWATFAAALAISLLGLTEFYGLFWREWAGVGKKVIGAACAVLLFTAARHDDPLYLILVLSAGLWLGNLFFLYCFGRKPNDAFYTNAAVLTAGLLYVPLPLALLMYMRPAEIVFVLLAVVASDTGAYFAGSQIGGPKIWPTVSPKKTWAGSAGGMAACVAVCLLFGRAASGAPLAALAVAAVVLNLAAQFGDFFESALKRWLGVKDSGTILPGHGGVLDRIDGLLLAVPVYVGLRALYPLFT
ncbi:phosphatidate cytidylyltransferase [Desulfovibrio sp. X2]|uniref:phosphatidate cytidylyltransferase n=1 Tax=Desulfovibrio sp. X2 TaxID=941449 RepID=UPI000358B284|nr:phosphatidate cytidylyltransferase [Desulfovibrio sp. X2]EPR44358.1 phosphatidate cytidylyltransferase [Desulfovibrio sp. X2]